MTEQSETALPDKKTIVWRGICDRCPQCGKGKIFASYLKQNDKCSVCGEDFSRFRADDGPAWLTILVTGHIMVPTAVYVARHDMMSQWTQVTVLLVLTTVIALLVLPRSKGIFICVLWLLAKKRAATKSV
ncbi:MAG: DUF983 domain-containing protein [Alphaproteobacteria bacterium]